MESVAFNNGHRLHVTLSTVLYCAHRPEEFFRQKYLSNVYCVLCGLYMKVKQQLSQRVTTLTKPTFLPVCGDFALWIGIEYQDCINNKISIEGIVCLYLTL